MARFEIHSRDQQRVARIRLQDEEVFAEAGAIHEIRGTMDVVPQSTGRAMFGRALTGQKLIRNQIRGTGHLWLGPPTFGELAVLTLRGEGWILDRGAYVASFGDVSVGTVRNTAITAARGGEGWFQTTVRGQGEVLLRAPGRLERVDLRDDELVVDGTFAVARTDDVHFSTRRLGGMVGSLASGEGVVQVYRGRGTVLLAPTANLWEALRVRRTSRPRRVAGTTSFLDRLAELTDWGG